MAETEIERRRRIMREGDFLDRLKTFGYHLGDNILGFEDGYDTRGERFVSGVRESVSGFLDDPVGTSYDALQGFASDVDRAIAGEADPVEYLMLGSTAIGGPVGVATGRAASRASTDVADAAFDSLYRRQLDKAVGDPESFEWLGNAAFKDVYVPSDIEESMMYGNPDIAQQIYLDRRRLASEMLDQGAPDKDIFEQTGMLHIPIRSVEGDTELGVRAVGFFDPEEGLVEQLRPNRYGDVFETIEDLPENVSGLARYNTREIVYPRDYVPTAEDLMRTRAHELTHFDLYDSDLPMSEAGSNVAYEDALRSSRINELSDAIEKTTDPKYREFLQESLEDVQRFLPKESYYNNPGERIARLREGDYATIRQMSPLEQLNPYMGFNRDLSLIQRIGNAIRRSRGQTGLGYVTVPMTKVPARVSDPNYTFIPK